MTRLAPLAGRSGKLARLEEIVETVFAAGERILVFTHFAQWGERLATHLTAHTGVDIACYHGGLARGTRDRLIEEFQGEVCLDDQVSKCGCGPWVDGLVFAEVCLCGGYGAGDFLPRAKNFAGVDAQPLTYLTEGF